MYQIPIKCLNEAANVLAYPLSNVIIVTAKLSIFPEECKIAKLKPLFKKSWKTGPKKAADLCVCLCSSTCLFLPSARHLWYTWEVRINDRLLWAFSGCFCQVPSSLSPNLSYFTSKDENSSRSLTGEKTICYNVLREKMIYIDIVYKSVRLKPTSYEKILKIRRLLLKMIRRLRRLLLKMIATFRNISKNLGHIFQLIRN